MAPKKKKRKVPQFEKDFIISDKSRWKDSIIRASEIPAEDADRISTGNLALDIATFGGIPKGRIARFYGLQKSAKTGSCLKIVKEWQNHCSECFRKAACDCSDRDKAYTLWIDAEGKLADPLNKRWVENHGIDMDYVYTQRPKNGEEIVDLVLAALQSGDIGLVVIDSIAHMTSKDEIEKLADDGKTMAVGARLINSAMRKWSVALTERGYKDLNKLPTIILINQLRESMDKYSGAVMPGGKGQDYATSLDINFRSSSSYKRFAIDDGNGSFKELKTQPSNAPDETPCYSIVKFKVTSSSQCDAGRSGEFNYWTRNKFGRSIGDTDDLETLKVYINRFEFIRKNPADKPEDDEKWLLCIPKEVSGKAEDEIILKGRVKKDVEEEFMSNKDLQSKLWKIVVEYMTRV